MNKPPIKAKKKTAAHLSIAAKALLEKHGSRLAIAELLLEDKLDPLEQKHLDEILNKSVRWAAKVRYAAKQKSSRQWNKNLK